MVDACVAASTETCNNADDDCDGRVDEDFDFTSDLLNCGSCGTACSTDGTPALCMDGTCHVSCYLGRADCDTNPLNGCEADLSSPATCGTCMTECGGSDRCGSSAGGSYSCSGDCPMGTTDCSGTCIDLYTDARNCGDCGAACPTGQTCNDGSCVTASCGGGLGWAIAGTGDRCTATCGLREIQCTSGVCTCTTTGDVCMATACDTAVAADCCP